MAIAGRQWYSPISGWNDNRVADGAGTEGSVCLRRELRCQTRWCGQIAVGEVPDEEYILPIGVSDLKRAGQNITIVTYSRMLHVALTAAEQLSQDGIECEVIDLRTLRPLDMAPVYESVKKTHRMVVLEEDWVTCGMGAEIAVRVSHDLFDELDMLVERLGQVEVLMPYAKNLEALMFPTQEQVVGKIKGMFA